MVIQTPNFTFFHFTKILLRSPLHKNSLRFIYTLSLLENSLKLTTPTAFQRDKSRRFSKTNYATAFQRDKSGRFSGTITTPQLSNAINLEDSLKLTTCSIMRKVAFCGILMSSLPLKTFFYCLLFKIVFTFLKGALSSKRIWSLHIAFREQSYALVSGSSASYVNSFGKASLILVRLF